jgi:hypothetical protein
MSDLTRMEPLGSLEGQRGEQSSPHVQASPQQTTVTPSLGSPVLVTTCSQVTGPQGSGSQATGPQVSGSGTPESTSGSLSSGDGVEQGESPARDITSERRKSKWLQVTLREAQGSVGSPRQVVRESKPLERFCSYIAMVSSIREFEPSTFEEATSRQVWRDAMMEEYNSIMKNDVWEVVPRPFVRSSLSEGHSCLAIGFFPSFFDALYFVGGFFLLSPTFRDN